MDCGCGCHLDTGAAPNGCASCQLNHQSTLPYSSLPVQPIIDYTPAMLGKLDKIIELLEKILTETEMLEKEARHE